jgi:dinuclear metal center YbgI/SA1388 family protein
VMQVVDLCRTRSGPQISTSWRNHEPARFFRTEADISAPLQDVVTYLDDFLETREVPDYPGALNGLQLENRGTVHKIAAAVDFSSRVIDAAIEAHADLLLVHHGMFWNGSTPIVGVTRDRLSRLLEHDIAVYSSHLPLDKHAEVGNNVLLAKELGLEPTHPFASYKGAMIGFRGSCDLKTADLVQRLREFSRARGGEVIASVPQSKLHITSWAICTGSGASAETINEAIQNHVDVLIVGEGPHWTAIEAEEQQLAILYAGHYATETLGVAALAETLAQRFSLDRVWINAPTGL